MVDIPCSNRPQTALLATLLGAIVSLAAAAALTAGQK